MIPGQQQVNYVNFPPNYHTTYTSRLDDEDDEDLEFFSGGFNRISRADDIFFLVADDIFLYNENF